MTAPNAARLLATQSSQSGRNVVLCDTTGQVEKEMRENSTTDNSAFPVYNIDENLSVITGTTGSSFFTSKTFSSIIQDLAGRFDQVFVCTSKKNSQLGLMALLEFAPSLVMISGLRKTKKADIRNIKSKQPIDFYFMTKLLTYISSFFVAVLLVGCSQVLQNVDLEINSKDNSLQQEFNVVEKTLTIGEAKAQKAASYSRAVLKNARGSSAQPIPENLALKSEFPKNNLPIKYKIGIGDTITLSRAN